MTYWNVKLAAPFPVLPNRDELLSAMQANGAQYLGHARQIPWMMVSAPNAGLIEGLPGVVDYERDTGCDPCQPRLMGAGDMAPWHLAALDIQTAHTVSTGRQSRIALLDTGIVLQADLAGAHVDVMESFVPGEGPLDLNGHGTGMASLLAGQGPVVHGVAPDAEILSLKVLDKHGRGRWSWIALAIERASEHRADIAVMALGGADDSLMVEEALQHYVRQGGVPMAAAGNSADNQLDFPGASAYAITVAAVDEHLDRPSWSNWSPWDTGADVSAPGVNIPVLGLNGYRRMSGTSPATALAGGVLALGPSPGRLDEARRRMHLATVPIQGHRAMSGYGLLNAARMVGYREISEGVLRL